MHLKQTSKKESQNKNLLLETLIKGMSNRDKESLITFYEITKTDVYSFILSIIKNKEDAEDIFQEVYIKVYENANMYQFLGKPLAWLLTIAKNLCYMKLRNQKEFINIEELYNLGNNEKITEKVENKLIIETIFMNISDLDRHIIILHVISGLKHKEIASILDLPLSTVLSKYNRAIKKLKKILKEDIK